MTGQHVGDFSRSGKPADERPEDFSAEETMIYAPGQREALLEEAKKEKTKGNEVKITDTQFNVSPQFGEDFKQFGENPTEISVPHKTMYEKANEGDVEEARQEVIQTVFYNALGLDGDDIKKGKNVIDVDFDKKRVKEKELKVNFDLVDPILAGVHLKQAKELDFDNYEQMRDDFMKVIPKAIKLDKIEGLPGGSDPKFKDPKKEAQRYVDEIEEEMVEELDQEIEEIAV